VKTPFEAETKLVPTELSESFKQELLREKSPRYIWVQLPEPIRQIGCDFSYAVIPVRLTSDNALEQCGRGVLCQTLEEAKESLDLLTQQAKEPIVAMQSAGFGCVGKITKIRSIINEISVRFRTGSNGKKEWWAFEREIDKATGEVTVLRKYQAKDECEAKKYAEQWLEEYNAEKKKYFDSVEKSNTPLPPPKRCAPLTQSDLKDDLPAAKWEALKRQWPHTFEIFEKRKANPSTVITDQECQDAYLVDLVERGYDPKAETIRADLQLCAALAKAHKKYASEGRRKTTDLAVYQIAFNWELGWCYLSDTEIARKLEEVLKMSFTSEQVEKYRYRTLCLVAKRLPGPEPKSSA
jgi:hypothetical protein